MSNPSKFWGLIVHRIILGLKCNLNFLKGSFIPWRLFFWSGVLPGVIFCGHSFLGTKFYKGDFPSGVSYNFSTIFFRGRIKSLICVDVLWLTFNMREAFLQYASLRASFSYKQYFYKQLQAEIGEKIKQMLNNTLRLNFWYPKTIDILHPHYHLTMTGPIHEIMQLIIMKMKNKMKIDQGKCGINRPRCRHGHKYSKYVKRLSKMMLICIKQHISNI